MPDQVRIYQGNTVQSVPLEQDKPLSFGENKKYDCCFPQGSCPGNSVMSKPKKRRRWILLRWMRSPAPSATFRKLSAPLKEMPTAPKGRKQLRKEGNPPQESNKEAVSAPAVVRLMDWAALLVMAICLPFGCSNTEMFWGGLRYFGPNELPAVFIVPYAILNRETWSKLDMTVQGGLAAE